MSWLKKHWRKLALLVAGAASALAAEHTLYKTTGADRLVPTVINAIPCTPGEAGCPGAPAEPAKPSPTP
jgi:hypothetical protein